MASGYRNWIGFFILGAINNLPYVIVNSAASTIADSFQVPNDVGLVFFANVALSLIAKSLNTLFLLNVPFGVRYGVNGVLMLIGLFGVAYANTFGFALSCIVVSGTSAAFGENVTLGFLSLFPSHLVNAWSSGTGMAGLLGAGIYTIFGCTISDTGSDKQNQLRHLTKYAFLLTTPFVILYWISYCCVVQRPRAQYHERTSSVTSIQTNSTEPPPVQHQSDEKSSLIDSQGSQSYRGHRHPSFRSHVTDTDGGRVFDQTCESFYDHHDYHQHRHRHDNERKLHRYWRCFKLVCWLSVNLASVYMFEYVARACAAKVRPSEDYNIGCPELYAALQLCYQAGVFASRSSVQLVQIRRVEVLSLLQLINMVVWLVDTHYKFMPIYVLPVYMIVVGLLGGAAYVNIFYLILNEDKYPSEDRELCVNITGLFITLGICLGSGLETLIFNTILKND